MSQTRLRNGKHVILFRRVVARRAESTEAMPEYGNVVLTLSNVLLPLEKLYPQSTPSMLEGLPWTAEYDLRLTGCELIQTAGLLLKLPQVETQDLLDRKLCMLLFV